MKRAITLLVLCLLPLRVMASGHGPIFGLATPTNSQGEWSFDQGVFGRSTSVGSQASIRELVGYGFTPHLTLSFTLPVVVGDTRLPPTRIQPGDDFDSTLAWRFQHRATKVGTRIESTAFAGLVVPGPQSAFNGVANTSNVPGFMVGAVTGTSLAQPLRVAWSHVHASSPSTTGTSDPMFSTTAWCMDIALRSGEGHRTNGTGDCSANWWASVLTDSSRQTRRVANTQAHQVFLGPSALGIYRNYTVSFGAQFPIYQDVGAVWPKERVRFAVNFSYLLFQHSH